MNAMADGQFMRGAPQGYRNPQGMTAPNQAHGLLPRFFKVPRKCAIRGEPTKEEPLGPITGYDYRDVEMIEILMAGDMKLAPVEKVTDRHRQEFAVEYEAFKRGEEMAATGTPLEIWPMFATRPAAVQALKMRHIYTVEALANLNDNQLMQLRDAAFGQIGMDPRELRTMAAAYVEARKIDEPHERLSQENEQLRGQVQLLEQQIAAINARFPEMEAAQRTQTEPPQAEPPRRGPGRPSKK